MSSGAPWERTLTQASSVKKQKGEGRDNLYLVSEASRPWAGGARYGLSSIDEVLLGRAGERGAQREGRKLSVGIPDGWMSSRHARLMRVMGQWAVEDLQSKNGTWVNGAEVTSATLADGDLLEVGRSFFLIREREICPGPAPLEVDTSALAVKPVGVRTLIPALNAELEKLSAIARSDIAVLICGESGTGKEVVARALHLLSQRSGEFVGVNAGALPRSLLEAELFGHQKGAFSGADRAREGLLPAASGGTFFLDEVGDLPLDAQPAFLRALQEKEVLPVGATRPVSTDARVISATHRDLDQMAEAETFRADLLARLSGFILRLPPLRERRADLGLLIGELLAAAGHPRAQLKADAARFLLTQDWPLNVRALEKALRSAVVLSGGEPIGLEHLPQESGVRPPVSPKAKPPSRSEEDQERKEALVKLLREHRGNISAVSRAMGKARMQIQRWLKRYQLDPRYFE